MYTAFFGAWLTPCDKCSAYIHAGSDRVSFPVLYFCYCEESHAVHRSVGVAGVFTTTLGITRWAHKMLSHIASQAFEAPPCHFPTMLCCTCLPSVSRDSLLSTLSPVPSIDPSSWKAIPLMWALICTSLMVDGTKHLVIFH